MDKENELKPCPHCGGEPVRWWNASRHNNRFYYVECSLCGARSKSFAIDESQAHGECEWSNFAMTLAIENWNRRVGEKGGE